MKKILLTVLLTLGCAVTAHAQTLDGYGGDNAIPCSSWTSPYFGLLKISSKWYFCTPVTTAGQGGATVPANAASHAFVAESVGAITLNNNVLDCSSVNTNPIFVAKYGGSGNGDPFNIGLQILQRIKHWGFNSAGQDSAAQVFPYNTCNSCVWPGTNPKPQPIPVPYIYELRPAEDSAWNANGQLNQAVKDMKYGLNSNYSGYGSGATYDIFDPNVSNQLVYEVGRNDVSDNNVRNNYPFLLGIFTDDSDWFYGSGAGPDFPSQPSGHTNANIGWLTLITSPVQTLEKGVSARTNTPELYSVNSQVITKAQATNPVTACSITNPCSLRDYLWQKYGGSISSLDTAWGGATYTSFDSTGTQVTAFQPSGWTGNGSTVTFTATLTTPISPYSVMILVGGVAQAGDCPWFHTGSHFHLNGVCPTNSPNVGQIVSATSGFLTASTINYSTGAISLTFATAPAVSTAITLSYVHGGWMAGGTGLMDESGSGSWVGTNEFCLEGANSSYPTYFTCVAGQNGVPTANATTGADLDAWISQYAAFYHKTMQADLAATGSHIPYFGLDTVGSWGVPSFSKFLQGVAPYVSGSFIQLYYDSTVPADAVAYQYQTQYGSDIPLMNFFTLTAQADSSYSCHSLPLGGGNFATEAQRGQFYYNTLNYFENTNGFNGDTQFVGFNFWSWIDSQNTGQGLVSVHDNAYNSTEPSSLVVSCDSYYAVLSGAMCGSESTTFGDAITQITNANALWLGGTPPSIFQVAPNKKGIWGTLLQRDSGGVESGQQ